MCVPPSWQLEQTSLRTATGEAFGPLNTTAGNRALPAIVRGAVAVTAFAAALRKWRTPIAHHCHRALQNGGDLRVVAMARQTGAHAGLVDRDLRRRGLRRPRICANAGTAPTVSVIANSSVSASICFISVPLVLAWLGSLSARPQNPAAPLACRSDRSGRTIPHKWTIGSTRITGIL